MTQVGWTGARGTKVWNTELYDWIFAKVADSPSSKVWIQTGEFPLHADKRSGTKFSVDFASNNNNGFRWLAKVNGNWYFSPDFGANDDHGSISTTGTQASANTSIDSLSFAYAEYDVGEHGIIMTW